MFFIPLLSLIFIFILPLIFILVFFNVISFGFENLGISSNLSFLIFLAILVGSAINIPLTKRKFYYIREKHFFGLFSSEKLMAEGLFINLGGAIIPLLLCLYFLLKIPLEPVLIATGLMTLICYSLSRFIPKKGVVLPAFIPPLFAAVFSVILCRQFAAPCAFVSGVLGTLIGADIFNLPKVRKYGGFLSIGGAGVFDGIFLTGIVSAFLTGI